MNIGEVAKLSGMSAKMIRHYEETGLIRAVARTGANYRVYTRKEVEVLRFIHQARHLGFSTRQIAILLALWEDRSRPSSEVKRLASEHIADLNRRIQELVGIRDTLLYLAANCKGDSRPDCPILEKLAGEAH
ncbi:TPA: Cu(I)-responsive transcriptional regulator [Burkholderia vietnamiensis]|uniref:Cu(I)-responsive transcriptional regulator n=1 Tax=Burkholderia cepacia complex TaxID=87882 RepID=UPI000755DBA7|nr:MULTISPECIES: Cu(I)-responsive transcriptional regulator [Burkholderia cepacia complex]KVS32308.1 MerR family transcriptional regulator [Burkholderia vietnamiensis]MBR8016465.1 Cu(I)-responsive transcriptional regulator [Burkholderia vietnamiensis]HDR9045311.1 Cu(I)-responsive transcriptional regulator [Burkholderia vietnamiensis]HDR9198457.1 Cu(I)-responsive transcriptional regulator [Burkholderia vietnamiensis]